jgi:hypothetical protein
MLLLWESFSNMLILEVTHDWSKGYDFDEMVEMCYILKKNYAKVMQYLLCGDLRVSRVLPLCS